MYWVHILHGTYGSLARGNVPFGRMTGAFCECIRLEWLQVLQLLWNFHREKLIGKVGGLDIKRICPSQFIISQVFNINTGALRVKFLYASPCFLPERSVLACELAEDGVTRMKLMGVSGINGCATGI